MRKKYVVRLSDEEHRICAEEVGKLKVSSPKARRARILLQRDADGPGWSVRKVAETYRSRVRTNENVRRCCVLEGFQDSDLGREYPAIACSLKAHWEEILPFFLFTDTVR